jgi:hypothetical protein
MAENVDLRFTIYNVMSDSGADHQIADSNFQFSTCVDSLLVILHFHSKFPTFTLTNRTLYGTLSTRTLSFPK